MRKEWENAHKVTEELVEGPPSKRANATLTACPNGNHLWSIGGEYFSEDGRAHFYNDVFRYSPEKDEWRKFVTPTCPGPRSAHAVAATPAGGGKLFLFGGEFSSLHQTTFHHYGDFWCFDVTQHTWDRIETKVRPSPRSGHRMATWKHFIVLFGGFFDPGITTRYLNDLWIFDTQEYTWKQVEFKETELRPSPRSGFSLLPCPEGVLLHGGYCKQYSKGKRPVGVMLEDTWLLKLALPEASASTTASAPTVSKSRAAINSILNNNKVNTWSKSNTSTPLGLVAKWERRKRPSDAFAPSLRSGCTMAMWVSKGTGVLFGGVTDEDKNEETLESVFHNDLFGYQIPGKGRWISLMLKKPKAKGAKKSNKKPKGKRGGDDSDSEDEDGGWEGRHRGQQRPPQALAAGTPASAGASAIGHAVVTAKDVQTKDQTGEDEDPSLTVPLPRYNTMLAVLRNTLYIYGGIFEKGSKEYTLDDFHSLQLDKLDRYTCLRPLTVEIPIGEDEESSDDDDDEDEDDDEDGDEGDSEFDDEYEEGAYDYSQDAKDAVGDAEADEAEDVKADDEDEDGDQELMSPVVEESVGIEKSKKRKERKAKKQDIEESKGVAIPDSSEPGNAQGGEEQADAEEDTLTEEDKLKTPLPGETLAVFFSRTRGEYWSQKAASVTEGDNRGKELRKIGFGLAESRYDEYKPRLQELEKILAEAGLDESQMRASSQGQGAGGGAGVGSQSRNRR
ncbi:galactose oxidase [Coprinopsis marcescibilis]|uniref:Galactose oxidase n=1 Tax=Coprinopsis marcescibilis TaxID=230819 RepID=A0A5C3KRY1_COPMA|nr:galactose oxidase [Coprinopsis marcescibilis]